MPSALLEQSRSILRQRFSCIIVKRIYTLEFDRSIDNDPEKVIQIFSKLDSARIHGDVVCASPEAVKSLVLKFIEHLHCIEKIDVTSLKVNESLRNNKESLIMREKLEDRSFTADSLVNILNIWREGILIMDE